VDHSARRCDLGPAAGGACRERCPGLDPPG